MNNMYYVYVMNNIIKNGHVLCAPPPLVNSKTTLHPPTLYPPFQILDQDKSPLIIKLYFSLSFKLNLI